MMISRRPLLERGRLVVLLALLPLLALAQHATGRLSVHYLNVGQADAIYIECPEAEHHNMLIDSGDLTAMRYPGSPKLFQDQLKALMGSRKHLDVVVSTHPHSDHTGSLLWVLNNFEVGTFIDDGMQYDSATYKAIEARAKALADAGKLKFLHATDLANNSTDSDFCPATNLDAVLVKPSNFGHDPNPNNNSVVIRLTYDQETFLFTGDAETEEEALLLQDPGTKPLIAANVLKAGHHGSNTSSSQAFLDAIHPKQVVVSAGLKDVGTNKGYKHPRAETIRRFLQYTADNGTQQQRMIDAFDTAKNEWTTVQINKGIYDTALDGTVVLLSDGQNTWNEADAPPSDGTATGVVAPSTVSYVYTKGSKVYHFADCADARNIKSENRIESSTPPKGKELHRGCPR